MATYSRDYQRRTKRVSSRLAKTQQQQIMRQTWMLLGGAALLIFVFIFFILPGLIRLITDESPLQNLGGDTIPPQAPVLSAPVQATYSAQLAVNGFGEPASQVVFILNGSEVDRATVDPEGSFSAELSLEAGTNTLSVFALDEAENQSTSTRDFMITLDQDAPTIELETPTDGQAFELRKNQIITIKGTTEPRAIVLVNGRRLTAGSEGGFSTTLQLEEGDNTITLEATDQAGNTSQQEMTVSFRF